MKEMDKMNQQQVNLSVAEEVAKTISRVKEKDQELVAVMLNAYADGFIAGRAFQQENIAS